MSNECSNCQKLWQENIDLQLKNLELEKENEDLKFQIEKLKKGPYIQIDTTKPLW